MNLKSKTFQELVKYSWWVQYVLRPEMFIGRGLKQDKPVATSSLIFVLNTKMPPALYKVEIINYKNSDDNIGETLENILNGEKINKREILQEKLLPMSSTPSAQKYISSDIKKNCTNTKHGS